MMTRKAIELSGKVDADHCLNAQIPETHPGSQSTKLELIFVLRLHKLATTHARSKVRRLGKVDPRQRAPITAKLRQLFRLETSVTADP